MKLNINKYDIIFGFIFLIYILFRFRYYYNRRLKENDNKLNMKIIILCILLLILLYYLGDFRNSSDLWTLINIILFIFTMVFLIIKFLYKETKSILNIKKNI
jgi:hypothetical protein